MIETLVLFSIGFMIGRLIVALVEPIHKRTPPKPKPNYQHIEQLERELFPEWFKDEIRNRPSRPALDNVIESSNEYRRRRGWTASANAIVSEIEASKVAAYNIVERSNNKVVKTTMVFDEYTGEYLPIGQIRARPLPLVKPDRILK